MEEVMNSVSLRENRQVDLNQLSRNFTIWQGKYQDLILQNSNLKQEIQCLTSQSERDKKTEKSSQEELKQLRVIVDSLQDSVAKRCNLEDENKTLKESIKSLEEKVEAVEKEGKAAVTEAEKWLEVVHSEQMSQMKETHHQEIIQREEKVRILEKSVQDKSAEAKQLQKQFAEAEKNRQTEIVKLRLEYDAKLLKLHSANTRTIQRNDKPTSVSSHIFREKMLNAQAASEKEVAYLKQTVSDLKRKLDSRVQQTLSAKRKF